MSQPTDQQPSPTKRPRSARGTKNSTEKHVTAATDNKPAVQPVVPPEASSQPQTSEPPTGIKWGEFPPAERQAELKRILEAWDQQQNHGNRPGPFVKFELTGADVYWLGALAAGRGDVVVGTKKLKEALVDLSALHLEGADLGGAHLKGASLSMVHLEGANLGGAHLEGADLTETDLTRQVNLRAATFDVKTKLAGARLDATLQVADVVWNGVSLIQIDWGQVKPTQHPLDTYR